MLDNQKKGKTLSNNRTSVVDDEDLIEVEVHTFPVIETVTSIIRASGFRFAVGDSTAVRSYTPFKRDLGDLDILFPLKTDNEGLFQFIIDKLPKKHIEPLREIHSPLGTGCFIRTRYWIDVPYRGQNYFIVDFHVGGSVFYNQFACQLDEAYFSGAIWRPVTSVGELETVNLPIPRLEETLLFKLRKFIGDDKYDIISLLTIPKLDFALIANRSEFYGRNVLKQNHSNIRQNFDDLVHNWEVVYRSSLSLTEIERVTQNIDRLRSAL